MIAFIIICFILMLMILINMFDVDNKQLFHNARKKYLFFFWIYVSATVIVAVNKSAFWILLFPIILCILNKFTFNSVCENIKRKIEKEEQLKRKKEKIKYNNAKIFQLEKQIITNKKNKLKHDCINIIFKYTYISTIYKAEKLNECLYIIDNIKIQADINIAVRRCQKIIDELHELNEITKNRLNSQTNNTNANNKKKSNSTSYSYTVAGALKLFNLDKTATIDDIKSTYRKLAKMHHPDRGGNKDNFLKLNAAYETLKKHYSF